MANLGALMGVGAALNAGAQGIDKAFQYQMQELRQKRLEEIENKRLAIAEGEAKNQAEYRSESLRVDKVSKERADNVGAIERFMKDPNRTSDAIRVAGLIMKSGEYGEVPQIQDPETGETRAMTFDEILADAYGTVGGGLSASEEKDVKSLINGLHATHLRYFPDSEKTAMEVAAEYPSVMYAYDQQNPLMSDTIGQPQQGTQAQQAAWAMEGPPEELAGSPPGPGLSERVKSAGGLTGGGGNILMDTVNQAAQDVADVASWPRHKVVEGIKSIGNRVDEWLYGNEAYREANPREIPRVGWENLTPEERAQMEGNETRALMDQFNSQLPGLPGTPGLPR